MSRPIKITIVEPSLILRSGVIAVLQSLKGQSVEVFDVRDLDQLKTSPSWQRPDLLIVNPIFSLPQIKKEVGNPDVKCLALLNSLLDRTLLKAFDEVISIYDTSEQIQEKLTKLLSKPLEEKHQESLSQREKEIIACVIKGMTNKQIADELHLSSHTVISHRKNIAGKLQIHSTAGLTIYAIVNKLVDLPAE
ncbi:response regulator transcription factor [Candidatus Symbiothrix dinenymphae]|uniref:response regulator transcription factor n=1 Tax=Candidatus Symbiothrix dinenymphae TaxID=467085 RepID=UPI0006C58E07|nr:LuxR C-terminal-related transcriptional regulator [Candidatus Symbiothrix dinenymphae]GAP71577.1 bacterial regulatory proteins, luxR family [Candidatus Symbiothrix dinenymphae]